MRAGGIREAEPVGNGIPFPSDLPSGLLIDGRWRPISGTAAIDVIDPATEEVFASVASASAKDVDDALDSAQRGWLAWREVDAWSRCATLRRVAEVVRDWASQMAFVLTSEQGKPLAEARSEILAAADQFDWYADEARRLYGRTVDGHNNGQRILVRREPVGPVAAFTTWNFPALLPARKLAPALAAGCSVIVVPSEEAPVTATLLAEACLTAGVHPGAIGVLAGDPRTISDRLVRSTVIRKISLTGSVPVGRTLLRAAAENIIPATMELGGHAPVLVFADADVDLAARSCVQAKFRNAGQVCASPSRFYVHKAIADEFTEKFVHAAEALTVGDGRDPETDVGPLTSERRLVAADRLVQDAVGKGAKMVCGGGRDTELERGYFYRPTVLGGTKPGMDIMTEEPFVPVAPISYFIDFDQVFADANSTPYGLASYVFTRDLKTALLASERLDAGMVGVNTMLIATAEAPFGGVKNSGYGREGGTEGIDSYTVSKYVNIAF
jgi:succinate-semialdehyde dehydrogenase / glutarate-semialdehyde dehydrogenase